MTRWADVLTSLWILFVGVIYFGGFFVPVLGALTMTASKGYAMVLLIAVTTALTRRLRPGTHVARRSSDTKGVHG